MTQTFLAPLKALLASEDGQAMTSSISFMATCAVICAGVYYYGGARIYGFVDMIMHSPPPGTSAELFR